tara:strand:- start:3774 stop:5336 length:1563 start_codon:yes stop_codon:yes gene_type:complete
MKITRADGGSGSTRDVILEFQQDGTTSYVMGIDDTVGSGTENLFKIHSGSELIDASDFIIDTSGNLIFSKNMEFGNATSININTDDTSNKLFCVDDTPVWTTTRLGSIGNLSDIGVSGNSSMYFGGNYGNSNSNYNVGVGISALSQTGSDARLNNVAVGFEAGKSLTTGDDNVFIGYQAGNATTDIDKSVIIGSSAGFVNMTSNCDGNVGIGYEVFKSLTDATETTAVGYQALQALVGNNSSTNNGKGNTAIGYQALYLEPGNTSTGNKNTAIGTYALDAQDLSSENVAIGYGSGTAVTGSDGNKLTLIGRASGQDITQSIGITCAGYDSAQNLTTGDYGIYLGYQATASSSSVNDEIVISKGLTGKGANTTYIGGTSGVYNGLDSSTWNNSSDERLKRDITDCNVGLEELEKIRIVRYQFKGKEETPKYFGYDPNVIHYGVVAQESDGILEGFISKNEEGWYSSHMDPLIWCATKSFQQLHSKYLLSEEELVKQDEEIKTLKENISKMEQNLENILKNI